MFFPLATETNSKYLNILTRLFFVLGIIMFKYILDLYYKVYAPLFSYLGFKFQEQDEFTYILVFSIVILTAIILPLKYKKPSNIFLLFLYLMSYIPVTVLYSFDASASTNGFLFYTFFIIGLSLVNHVKFPILKSKSNFVNHRTHTYILYSLIILFLGILIAHYGIALNVKNYGDIYDVRSSFKEIAQKNKLLAISFSWMANVFTIFLLTISLSKKKWSFVLLALIIQFYLFNLGGNKSVFMLPIFISFIIFAIYFFKELSLLFILFSFVLMSYGLYFYDFVINDHFSIISSIFIRRNFFVTANLYFYYIDYFTINPNDFFAKSFPFNMFFDSYYQAEPPHIIGREYIRSTGVAMHANGNFLADLYYNFSWFGYFIGFVVIQLYISIIDTIAINKNYLVIIPIATIPVISLMNSGLIVNLISFGLVLIVLLLFMYPKEKKYIQK